MFVLPALIIPLVFGLAISRLHQVPRRLWLGELQLPGKQQALLHVATVAAYFVLLSYTIALSSALAQAFFLADDRLSAYLALLVYVAAYPVVYIGVAWVFYYGLKPNSQPRS